MVTYVTHETLSHALTAEGAQIALQGSHEARVWQACPSKGAGTPITAAELEQAVGGGVAGVGQGRAFKNKWIAKEGAGFVKLVSRTKEREQMMGSSRMT
jgi:phenylalanyl-tRNA synthetase alpha chain